MTVSCTYGLFKLFKQNFNILLFENDYKVHKPSELYCIESIGCQLTSMILIPLFKYKAFKLITVEFPKAVFFVSINICLHYIAIVEKLSLA